MSVVNNRMRITAEGHQLVPPLQKVQFDQETESDADRAKRLFQEGKFSDAIALANVLDAKLGKYSTEEKWSILIIESQMAKGDYAAALQTLDESLERFENRRSRKICKTRR